LAWINSRILADDDGNDDVDGVDDDAAAIYQRTKKWKNGHVKKRSSFQQLKTRETITNWYALVMWSLLSNEKLVKIF
jgi:hypothetical protein